MPSSVLLLAENLAEENALRAIFDRECELGEVEILSFMTPSGMLGVAELSLLESPDRPVILVLNSVHEDLVAIEDRRATIRRILSNASPGGWHVAMAVPDVDAWLRADPAVNAEFDASPASRSSRHERAARIKAMARRRPIDREAIGRAFPEFAALSRFIENSVRSLQLLA